MDSIIIDIESELDARNIIVVDLTACHSALDEAVREFLADNFEMILDNAGINYEEVE